MNKIAFRFVTNIISKLAIHKHQGFLGTQCISLQSELRRMWLLPIKLTVAININN